MTRTDSTLHCPEHLAEPAAWSTLLKTLRQQPWVVYLKPPLAGPEQVLEYLARYTHRVAISNERLLTIDDRHVRFRYRPPRGSVIHEKKTLCLTHEEFLRRFLLHVLPPGFKRIRHYGLTANRNKSAQLARCRTLLKAPAPTLPRAPSAEQFLWRVTGHDPTRCRHCHTGQLVLIRHLPTPTRLPELRATGPPAS